MFLEKLSHKEIELMGFIRDPVFFSECLFTKKLGNHESLKNYSDEEFAKIRLYQLPYMSYEYLLAEDLNLSPEKNFELKEGAGKGYFYTGRKTGKTLVALLIDLLLDTVHNFSDWITLVSAFDEDHVANICEPYISAMKSHPFFKLFGVKEKRKPYKITIPTGHEVKGINMNLKSREPGSHFESPHACKMVIDEHQYETAEVVKKRSQATSELGCIERFAGICSFTNASPAGLIFRALKLKNWIVNLPQTVSSAWNEKRKEEAIDDFGDESSPAYKIHVGAEVIEDAEGVYDIERIRACYEHNKKRPIKHFELHKDDINFYKQKIIVERPGNAETCYIGSDFGENKTEIIIIFEVLRPGKESLFKYIYNISLYKMTPDEQTIIFDYLIQKLEAELTGVDCSESGGKQVYRNLNKKYKQDNLVWVSFQEKIDVALKKDNHGKLIRKNNKLQWEQEYVTDWSIARIKKLFYDGERMDCLYDLKLDKEFNNMISSTRLRTSYASSINQDHLHQAFQVFAIMEWKQGLKKKNKPKTSAENWGSGSFA